MKIQLPGISFLLLLIPWTGCHLFDHLGHMDPPVILSSSPGRGYAEPDSVSDISITFSADMEKISTQRAFSLTRDNDPLEGQFHWEGNTMIFTPYEDFLAAGDYLITVKSEGEDIWGNSLLNDWYLDFTTRREQNPPEITAVTPADFSVFSTLRETVHISFSEPVDRLSFYQACRVSPALLMQYIWNDDDSQVTLSPLEDYRENCEYSITISTALMDKENNSLSRDREFLFYTNGKGDMELLSLEVDGSGTALLWEDSGINLGLEKDTILIGTCNRTLTPDEQEQVLEIKPAVDFHLEWQDAYSRFRLSFAEPLEYGGYYEITSDDKKLVILVDGPKSSPLSVERVVFCPDSTLPDPAFHTLVLNGLLNASDSLHGILDFYIEKSSLSEIDLTSFLDALSISSSVVDWDFQSVSIWDETDTPVPFPNPGEDLSVLRVRTGVSWSGLGGTVQIKIDSALKDTLENHLEESWSLTVSQL